MLIDTMNILPIQNITIIFIYGATGVGKTDLALAIAESIPSEIINMDVGQFYTPLSVGTAKPAWKDFSTPHHLFDIINEPLSVNVNDYRMMLIQKVNEIKQRGNLPIIVGGSAFYLYSALFPLKGSATPCVDSAIHHEGDLWQKLYDVDPERASVIEKSDSYRLMRALDIWENHHKKPTAFVPEYDPFSDYILLNIIRDKEELNNRINQRVVQMLDNGWIEETELLVGSEWEDFIVKKKLIGYNEIISFLKSDRSKQSYENMVYIIQNKTRQYAKRQRTFWKKLERDIANALLYKGVYSGCTQSINLTNNDIHLYINELIDQLSYVKKGGK